MSARTHERYTRGAARTAPIPGWVGWALTATLVTVWDIHPDTQTMSSAFAPEGTRGKRIYQAIWLLLTLHLCRLIPNRYDPLRRFDLLRWKIRQ